MSYLWQKQDWPNFRYNDARLGSYATLLAENLGAYEGITETLTAASRDEAIMQLLIAEAAANSAIEGVIYSREDLLSSIKTNLGLPSQDLRKPDANAGNAAALTVEAATYSPQPLTEDMVCAWHHTLLKNQPNLQPGVYRSSSEEMQVVSGIPGREVVHYQAPPAAQVPAEMTAFINWYNSFTARAPGYSAVIAKTAIAHLYFEAIHPFADGNGRVGRALAAHCLSQCAGRTVYASLSFVIESDKKKYYAALKQAHASLDVTPWVLYFAEVILHALAHAKLVFKRTVTKSAFLAANGPLMNNRQLKAVLKMLDVSREEFHGGMTARKFIAITGASRATATRDLQDLAAKGILTQQSNGRNVHYVLNV